jgi:murein L,D-transpeptidase YcbB/YkuD
MPERRFFFLGFPILLLTLAASASYRRAQATSSASAAGTRAPGKTPSGTASGELRALVASGRLEDLRWPNFSDYRQHVENFYRPANYAFAWIRDGQPIAAAHSVIEVLQRADNEGLNSEDYDGAKWAGRHSAGDEARFDLALTVCTIRYVSDVRIGRINPKHVKFAFDVGPKKLDLPRFLRQLIAAKDVRAALAEIEPPFDGYKRTRQALLRYVELAREDDGAKLPDPGKTIAPGDRYEGLPRLVELLREVGDLPAGTNVAADDLIYKEPVVGAIKHFQERHLLYDDGRIEKLTLEQLNTPMGFRVEQLRLTLERWRWLPLRYERPPIVVNIPEYYLRAFDGKGKVALTMNVNVGEAYDSQTPIFEGQMAYVVFRPYWDVPATIQRSEIVPSVEADRDYIHEYDFEVIGADGKVVTDGAISDSVLQGLRTGKLRVRQKPGPSNSLGLVKFIFPNAHNVYLHDTPVEKDMFVQAQRDLSHGCIHVKEPAQLAVWVLRDQAEWTLERVEQAMHEGRDNQRVNLRKPIPVLILYGTAIVEEEGDVYFTQDIYGHDRKLREALAKGYPYPG